MKYFLYLFSLFYLSFLTQVSAQYLYEKPKENENMEPEQTEFYEPKPPVISPGASMGSPPSDATILFDKNNLDKWESINGDSVEWHVEGDHFKVNPGKGDIQTKKPYEDVQLHIEWRTPAPPTKKGQDRGNSGVFLQGQYEVQVLDSYKNDTYTNGQAGSIYKDQPPIVNANKKPGEWQSYDIIYHAPVFNKETGKVKRPAIFTVFQNGVLIQDHVSIQGKTLYQGRHYYKKHGPLPLKLQDHGQPVSYRNIWIRTL